MSRIASVFASLQRDGKKGFIPFITAGDPDLETSEALLIELAHAGASVIELGVPFSDPLADGPVIQRASQRALRHGFGVAEVLAAVTRVRQQITTPIVLFSYFNPLLQFGVGQLAVQAARAGLDGLLVTDLALEEAGEWAQTLRTHHLDPIFLVAPTSTSARLRLVAEHASGFIYAISRPGVTGVQPNVSVEAQRLVERVREVSDLPVAVGFGISSRHQVREVWHYADAVVVGSAIVAEIERLAGVADLVSRIGAFARQLLP